MKIHLVRNGFSFEWNAPKTFEEIQSRLNLEVVR